MPMTREEYNAKQRARRKANGNQYTKTYEKTIQGFLMRTYRNMKSRVTGIQKKKAHLYWHCPLLSREEFYEWSQQSGEFMALYYAWVMTNYDQRVTPSIDRIDSKGGYVIGNMQWITHSENSRRGALSRYGKLPTQQEDKYGSKAA